MNILVVDDEVYSVKGIVEAVHWELLGIENVFTAYSMQQAQNVFEKEPIDILLADIEMPKGSGLDLAEWAYAHGHHPVAVFLTSYAKFEYAQKAIQLQCIGYLVKPASTETIEKELKRAVSAILKNEEQEKYRSLAEHWDSDLMNRTEALWRDLLSGTIPPKENSIRSALHKRQLPAEILSFRYYYVLAKAELNEESVDWEKALLDYAIQNILSEILYHEISAPVPDMGKNHFVLMCRAEQYASAASLLAACVEAAEACEKALPGKFTLFLSTNAGAVQDAANRFDALRKLESEYITVGSTAISDRVRKDISGKDAFDVPVEAWSEALLLHNRQKITDGVKRLLSTGAKFYPRALLNDLYYGILQVIYTALEKKNVPPKDLLMDDGFQSYVKGATESIPGFFRWLEFSLDRAEAELVGHPNSGSIAQRVCAYIGEHLNDEDLSRGRIAAEIHLNPDYLSFMFREKTGQSLVSFIASERIRVAKKLLISTDLSVRDVSIQTGYADISYFSKQFKQLTGMTPQQYRKSVASTAGSGG